MAKKLTQEKLLEKIHQKLSDINTNMLKVFWIVAIFAFLYFGLMLHLLNK
jgi:capsule polysaccharide export protein KpsE/RkpR